MVMLMTGCAGANAAGLSRAGGLPVPVSDIIALSAAHTEHETTTLLHSPPITTTPLVLSRQIHLLSTALSARFYELGPPLHPDRTQQHATNMANKRIMKVSVGLETYILMHAANTLYRS